MIAVSAEDSEVLAGVLGLIAFGLSVLLFVSSAMQRNKFKKLEKEKLNAELELLKSQVNPHFLFNSLNNIYGLILEGKDLAADSILKLSSLLRYMIYTSEKPLVNVVKRDLRVEF